MIHNLYSLGVNIYIFFNCINNIFPEGVANTESTHRTHKSQLGEKKGWGHLTFDVTM